MLPINAIIFSKDRPLQLDAAIRSFYFNCKDAEEAKLYVLYKSSEGYYKSLYEDLNKEHPLVNFIEQTNFKKNLIDIIKKELYIFFVVDDNIFTSEFSIDEIINVLSSNPDSIGFSLRLGKNINYCYPLNVSMRLPETMQIKPNILKSCWINAEHDFGYPLEVSSSVYLTEDIIRIICDKEFNAPNSLEETLWQNKNIFLKDKPNVLFYYSSAAFCNPINMVQTELPNNRVANTLIDYSPMGLAKKFEEGNRVDIKNYLNIIQNACHFEIPLYLENKKGEQTGDNGYSPLVSIIIPCYNQAEYLRDAVESVINQTYSSFEIIIVNDGSIDNTVEVMSEIKNTYIDYSITSINQTNEGPSVARNNGISLAKGKYILPLDADDKIHPDMLKICIDTIKIVGEKKIIYTARQNFGEDNTIIIPNNYDFEKLKYQNQLNYCALYSKKMWEDIGGYRSMDGYEDWDFWIAAGLKGYFAYLVPKVLFYYRVKLKSRDTEAFKKHNQLFIKIMLNNSEAYPLNYTSFKINDKEVQLIELSVNGIPIVLNGKDFIMQSIDSIKKFFIKLINRINEIVDLIKIMNVNINFIDFKKELYDLASFIHIMDKIAQIISLDFNKYYLDNKKVISYFDDLIKILENIAINLTNKNLESFVSDIKDLEYNIKLWNKVLDDILSKLIL